MALDPSITVAFISLAGTLAVAIYTAWTGQKMEKAKVATQRELDQAKARTDKELESFKAQLEVRKSDQDARRDYEYEARKRLYSEWEPLLFQLAEASESALHRIKGLARTARQGHLGAGKESWLGRENEDRYYDTSTLYKLLLPLAIVRLMQRRLTFIDLDLEPSMRRQYEVAKAIATSLVRDFRLADTAPKLRYEPNYSDLKAYRASVAKEPHVFWRQGIVMGHLETILDGMVVKEDKERRCMTYAEFERWMKEKASPPAGLAYLFEDFHPRTRPVLWRVLVLQAILHQEILVIARQRDGKAGLRLSILQEERSEYDWRQKPGEAPAALALHEPFEVAAAVLRKDLQPPEMPALALTGS